MNTLSETTGTVEALDELLTDLFGKAAPPKEEILRHKWLESEKVGRDIGLLAAAHDWAVKYYPYWKEFHVPGEASTMLQFRPAARRRLEFLACYLALPLAVLFFAVSLLQWATGIDYTDYISGPQIVHGRPLPIPSRTH
jgi:hypothetical protein